MASRAGSRRRAGPARDGIIRVAGAGDSDCITIDECGTQG